MRMGSSPFLGAALITILPYMWYCKAVLSVPRHPGIKKRQGRKKDRPKAERTASRERNLRAHRSREGCVLSDEDLTSTGAILLFCASRKSIP
jgi:hypothetical protein